MKILCNNLPVYIYIETQWIKQIRIVHKNELFFKFIQNKSKQ